MLKNLIPFLLIGAGLLGVWHIDHSRKQERRKLVNESSFLIFEQAQRKGVIMDSTVLQDGLEAMETGNLRLFNQYVRAVVYDSTEVLHKMMPTWNRTMLPYLQEQQFWERYGHILQKS